MFLFVVTVLTFWAVAVSVVAGSWAVACGAVVASSYKQARAGTAGRDA